MSKSIFSLSIAALAILSAIVLTTGVAFADEPPPEDFPPPAAPPVKTPPVKTPPPVDVPKVEAPKVEAPKVEAPKVEAPKADDAWSPPAVTAGGPATHLPPPQIVRRRGRGLPPKRPAPSAMQPAQPIAPTSETPVIRDVTAERGVAATPGGTVMPPAPTLPSDVRRPALMPPAPKLPVAKSTATAPTQPQLIPAARSGTRVIGVAKTHNVPLADGDFALQIDVDYEVRGQSGRDIYVGIWFVRKDTGKHIKSALTSYGDPTGFVTLQTRSSRVATSAARFAATLRIPYRAFPVATGADSYDVEARVQILRRESSGVSALARGTTEFRVYGAADSK